MCAIVPLGRRGLRDRTIFPTKTTIQNAKSSRPDILFHGSLAFVCANFREVICASRQAFAREAVPIPAPNCILPSGVSPDSHPCDAHVKSPHSTDRISLSVWGPWRHNIALKPRLAVRIGKKPKKRWQPQRFFLLGGSYCAPGPATSIAGRGLPIGTPALPIFTAAMS